MEGIVVAILSMLLVYALVPLFPWKRRQVSKSDEHNEEPQVEQDGNISRNHKCHPHDDDANVHHHELCHGKDEVSTVTMFKILLVAASDDKLEKRCVGHYNNQQKILLVGEGDFSFSSCLATAFLSASNLTATSLDSRGTVVSKYSKGKQNLRNLEERGAVVIHQVDAGTMNAHPRLRSKLFDRVVFNFPHAGGTYSAVSEHDSWYIELHQRVVRRFFTAARKMLTERGQVHVTHKTGYPFHTWEIIQLAENVGLVLIRCEPWRNAYAGYENKKAYGPSWDSTFPVRGAYNYMFCTSKS